MSFESKPGREVFGPTGDAMEDESGKIPWRIHQKRIAAKEEQGTGTKEFLQTINFGLLKQIFEEEYQRSGLDISQMNFLEPDQIYSNAGWGNAGEYDAQANLLALDADSFKRFAEKRSLDSRMMLLQGLCHEMAHAIQKTEVHVGAHRKYDYDSVGYRRVIDASTTDDSSKAKLKDVFINFSEGVTDRIGMEVSEHYAKQSGFAESSIYREVREGFQKWKCIRLGSTRARSCREKNCRGERSYSECGLGGDKGRLVTGRRLVSRRASTFSGRRARG